MRETPEQLAAYASFLDDVSAPWCWACGRDGREAPYWWAAPWAVCRAHVVSSPRVRDVRTIVALCSWCHERSHGYRFPAAPTPEINRANLLWLKALRDPDRLDPEFLARLAIGRLPDPEPLPDWYAEEYCRRRGGPVTIGTPGRVWPH